MLKLLKMVTVRRNLNQLSKDRRGIAALEYGLLAAVMIIAVTAGGSYLAGKLQTNLVAVGTSLGTTPTLTTTVPTIP